MSESNATIRNPTAKANLDVFAGTLQELAATDRNLLVVTSDSRGSGKLGPFGQQHPKQTHRNRHCRTESGGVAAGLASTGKNVFAVSPACFLTARSFEQIKTDVCYSNNPVRLVGISAGVSYGALGTEPTTVCTILRPSVRSITSRLYTPPIISRRSRPCGWPPGWIRPCTCVSVKSRCHCYPK